MTGEDYLGGTLTVAGGLGLGGGVVSSLFNHPYVAGPLFAISLISFIVSEAEKNTLRDLIAIDEKGMGMVIYESPQVGGGGDRTYYGSWDSGPSGIDFGTYPYISTPYIRN